MGYIITNDQYYRDIATAIRSKMLTDREYAPSEMASAIANIPSSADGTDDPITGIYFLNPDSTGFPTVIKIVGWKMSSFPLTFNSNTYYSKIETIEFISCEIEKMSTGIFRGLPNLNSIVFSNSLKEIPSDAFFGCSNIKEIFIPDGVQKIKSGAFWSCSSLRTINIPNTILIVDSTAFRACSNLEFVTLAEGFDANNLNLSESTKYSHDTILSWLNALADRTGLTAYTLTIGNTNLKKLSDSEQKIAYNKNWIIK